MSSSAPQQRDYLAKSVDITVRLGFLAIVFAASFAIFKPFLGTVVWASVIAVALYPVFLKLAAGVGGRRKLAGGIFIVISLALVLLPTFLLGESLLEGTVGIVKGAKDGTLEIPAPTEQVRGWPLIGERVFELWDSAHRDLAGTIDKLQPQIRNLGNTVVRFVSDLGGVVLQTLLAVIIAGVLMIGASPITSSSRVLARRLGGGDGVRMLETSVSTIRSVVKGVILVSLIQGLAAAVGLVVAGVPAAGLWSVLVVIVAVIQLPPILILGPVAVWVFANNDSTAMSIFFLIWSLAVSGADGVLKPILLGRGLEIPMLVILIGAIGGMLSSGILGLFIGPVVLAIAWELTMLWVEEARDEAAPAA